MKDRQAPVQSAASPAPVTVPASAHASVHILAPAPVTVPLTVAPGSVPVSVPVPVFVPVPAPVAKRQGHRLASAPGQKKHSQGLILARRALHLAWRARELPPPCVPRRVSARKRRGRRRPLPHGNCAWASTLHWLRRGYRVRRGCQGHGSFPALNP